MAKTGRLIAAWDSSEMFENEIKYHLENREDEIKEGTITEQEIRTQVYNDHDLLSNEWDWFMEHLSEIIVKKNPDGYWKAVVNNFGWRSLDGHKFLHANNCKELLREILPNTDCTFRIFNYGKGIAIQNFHHDSPCGREWYYITPCSYSTFYKMTA